MTPKQRIRRVGILCCHCLRNMAFYMAGWKADTAVFRGQFLINANNNFLDVCVLEWCKLFGDPRGKHYWKKVIVDTTDFFNGLLIELEITEYEFNDYLNNEMKRYRDKMITHLDETDLDETMKMDYPILGIAKNSAVYLYDYLLTNENADNYFIDAPKDALGYYKGMFKQGMAGYERND